MTGANDAGRKRLHVGEWVPPGERKAKAPPRAVWVLVSEYGLVAVFSTRVTSRDKRETVHRYILAPAAPKKRKR